MSVRCPKCGDVRSRKFSRACSAGGQCEYVGTEERQAPVPFLWLTCRHRDPKVLATVTGTQAGCGCGGTTVEVYQCTHFREPVLKDAAARCLEKIQLKVPKYKGRTCRGCEVPMEKGEPETLPACSPQLQTIGVVIPCHNYGPFLRECLDSVLAQTQRPESIIVVDDASEDDTPAVAAEYAARGVRYLRGEWRDVAAARNAGATLCGKVTYLCFVDADDYLPPNYLAELQAAMTSQTIAAAYPLMDRFSPSGEMGLSAWIVPFDVARLRQANFATASSLIRRQAFEQVGRWRTYRWGLHDWDLFLRMVAGGWKLNLCEKTALRYRIHGNSMSDGRHGHYECGAEVMSRSQLTAVVTLFSGRSWNLDRWFESLSAVEWEQENLHLVAVDNSRDPDFAARLREKLSNWRHTYIRDDHCVLPDTSAASLADSAAQRMKHAYPMGVHLARLYALASQYMPAATANVWSLEDDVGVAPDSLRTLATEMFRLRAAAVSGCLRNRFHNRRLLSWSGPGQQITEPPAKPMKLTGTGFFCLLTRRDAWDSIAWRAGATGTDRHPYYDWAACADIATVGPIYLIGAVRCRHWQADGSCLTV